MFLYRYPIKNKWLTCLILVSYIVSCNEPEKSRSIDLSNLSEPVKITDWTISRPFFPDPIHLREEEYLENDYLNNPGESDLSFEHINLGSSEKDSFHSIESILVSKPNIDLGKYYDLKVPAVTYLLTQIK